MHEHMKKMQQSENRHINLQLSVDTTQTKLSRRQTSAHREKVGIL